MRILFFILALIGAALPAYGETRGLALIPLKHPRFPVTTACSILKASPAPAFSVLHDETFGNSDKTIHALIRCILPYASTRKTSLRVHVYVACGPCRRPRRNGSVPHFFPSLDIPQFNAKLRQRDGRVTKAFVQRLLVLKRLVAKYPSVDWVIVPELEDNLSTGGFSVLAQQIRRVFYDIPVEIARNPLLPARQKEATEIHTYTFSRIAKLKSGDTVSGDGVADWPDMSVVRMCDARGIHFHLWRPEWQGITSNMNLPPSKRNYRFINVPRIKQIMRG